MKRYHLYPQFAGVLLLILLSLTGAGATESAMEHNISVNVPEALQIEVGDSALAFNLFSPNPDEKYPAASYPAYYTPTSVNKYVSIKLFSNCDKEWSLMIGGEADNGLKVQAIEWSLDQVSWFPLESLGQPMKRGGFTSNWLEIKVYFRLVMYGDEYGGNGEYKVRVFYNLSSI